MRLDEYLKIRKISLLRASQEMFVSYGTLHRHVRHGRSLSVETSRTIERWSGGQVSAAECAGLTTQDNPSTKPNPVNQKH